jgi:putative sigma-54 modulation protein
MPKTNAEIKVAVTFRHTEPTEALKNFVTEKLTQCVRKYVGYDTEVRAVLSVEKRDHAVEVQVHSKGFDASAKAVTDDLYSATDKVVDSLHAQLRKQKERAMQRPTKITEVSGPVAT